MSTSVDGGLIDGNYYNGAGWDPAWNNAQIVLAPSAARTAAPAIPTETSPNHRGVLLYLNVTGAGTGGLTLTLRGIEPVGGTAVVALLSAAQVTATGLYVYQLYPGIPTGTTGIAGVTQSQNGVLPRSWTCAVAHADASSWTYSLAGVLLL